MKETCPHCKRKTEMLEVHGHYQCPHCKCMTDECCQGENAGEDEGDGKGYD